VFVLVGYMYSMPFEMENDIRLHMLMMLVMMSCSEDHRRREETLRVGVWGYWFRFRFYLITCNISTCTGRISLVREMHIVKNIAALA